MNGWSGVLLITLENHIIAMHRDDNPKITNPGCYGIFGGAIEDEESPLEAAVREIKEETNIQVSPEDFEPFNVYEQKRDNLPTPAKLHVFVLRDINPATLKIYEGQGIKILKDSSSPNISKDVKVAFDDWFKLSLSAAD